MTADTLTPNVAQNSSAHDQRRVVDLWLRTWIALAAIVAVTVVVYLVFISSALANINHHLATTRDALTDVNGSTKTLPGQIAAVNQNLSSIDAALKPIPGQAETIRTNLSTAAQHGVSINGLLATTSTNLAGAAKDLAVAAPELNTITSQLANTSQLLTSILNSTGTISRNLVTISGNGPSGVMAISAVVSSIRGGLVPTQMDLGNVLSGLHSINGHLTNVCNSIAINALHGRQSC